ncbi:unnamed protein product [Arctia plantaginis]|uniref:Large subunit GTPase 1 homolog n=1 Tax=Arctia plantaginis TaxID=874455 RepID=A0A8S1BCK4_ARCPL|nr:unnamed protein product [Arctia plantaginis]
MGKKNKDTLGRALIKDRFSKNRHRKFVEGNSMLHTNELNDGQDLGRLNLQSITAESSLEEFLSIAELAQKEIASQKAQNCYLGHFAYEPYRDDTTQPNLEQPLTVPRRPKWHLGITAKEQLTRERESFLFYSYIHFVNLISCKMNLVLRNPLLFRCADLEQYAEEEKCKCILLLNKADLINEYERKCWAEYFTKENVLIIFFSAAKNTNERKISESSTEAAPNSHNDSETESAYSEDESDNEKENLTATEEDIEIFKKQVAEIDIAVRNTSDKIDMIQENLDKVVECLRLGKPIDDYKSSESTNNENVEEKKEIVIKVQNSHEIFDREQLLEVLKNVSVDKLKNPPRLTVGMIGYPNVGKSSTVNVIMQTKKVSVSSMPGHTRHIQSLMLDDDIEMLDCPGLVLPAYAVAPDLLLTAVLPIDQMRSHDAAMARLCQLISKQTFMEKYGLLLPDDGSKEPDHKQILTAHAFNRGFMTAAGQPDQSRSARLLLKEAASGRLRWAQLPLGAEPQPLDIAIADKRNERRKPTPREVRAVEGWRNKSLEIDSAFFTLSKSTAHVKENPVLGIVGAQPAGNATGAKPWKQEKKHKNKNKREKLRRVYASLDEH